MDIVFSVNNNEEIMVLPVVPPEQSIDVPQDNEDFDAIGGAMKLIGNMGLRKLSIQSFFPVHKSYSFVKSGAEADGWKYVEFFDRNRKRKIPFRVVVSTADGARRLNMPCVINKFTYMVDAAGDIQYTLEAEEYRFVGG